MLFRSLVAFDPFANADQSFATTNDDKVSILHNRPQRSMFYHLCDGNTTTDIYDMDAGTEQQPDTYVARANLNGDPFDDLVYINASAEVYSILLGLGAPDSNNRIMLHDNQDPDYYAGYAPNGGTDFDRVICSDLNLDGDDDIVITRYFYWGTTGACRIVVIQHSGIMLP